MNDNDIKAILSVQLVQRTNEGESERQSLVRNAKCESKTVTSDYLSFLAGRIESSDGPRKLDCEARHKGLSPFLGDEYLSILLQDDSDKVQYVVGIHAKTGAVLYFFSTN